MSDFGKGLTKKTVSAISAVKNEPDWMREKRLRAFDVFTKKNLPAWAVNGVFSALNFDEISYFERGEGTASSWDDVPVEIRKKYDELGIPDAEQEYLAGVGTQFQSEMVYHSLRKELIEKGIVFVSMDDAVRDYGDIVRQYMGTVIADGNNKFSALNGSVWSGGSFVYIPQGVYLEAPLHTFFHIGSESFGQFERTLIIAEEGSSCEFVEGCVAPLYREASLHAGVVEIIVKKGAHVRYSTMQNWSRNVLNLVTKASRVEEGGAVEWIDGNIGSGVTMKYPSMVLAGRNARGSLISLALSGEGQVIDSGGKAIHLASETVSRIESKSVVKPGGRSVFRGLVHVGPDAKKCKSSVSCTALHLGEDCRSDTYPQVELKNGSAELEHESSVLQVGEEQLLYLRSRGIDTEAARRMIVGGFVEPFTQALPLEYAVEFNRLIELEIENGVG